jgi:methyl-accepting chemotaxis protein
MKLGTKLMLGFAAVAVITLFLGSMGFYGAVKRNQAIEEIGLVRLPSVERLLGIQVEAENIRGSMRTLGIPGLGGCPRISKVQIVKKHINITSI